MPGKAITSVLNRTGKTTGRGNGWTKSRVGSPERDCSHRTSLPGTPETASPARDRSPQQSASRTGYKERYNFSIENVIFFPYPNAVLGAREAMRRRLLPGVGIVIGTARSRF
jgi:hypothetical protein